MHWKAGDRASLEHKFTKADVDAFVNITSDDNPIHVDQDYASKTEMGQCVVHGMLVASFISTVIGKKIPGDGSIWLSFDVQWKKPVFIDTEIVFEAVVLNVNKSLQTLDISITAFDKSTKDVYLESKALAMNISKKKLNKSNELKNSNVLIVGATSKIGQEIAKTFGEEGAHLYLTSRKLENFAPTLKAKTFVLDFEKKETLDQNLDNLSSHIGNLDHLIFTISAKANEVEVSDDNFIHDLEDHLEISIIGFLKTIRTFLPILKTGGSITIILSEYVIGVPPLKLAAYTASKKFLQSIVESLAVENGPKGIRCNAVAPGMINSPFSSNVPVRLKQIEEAKNPLRRLCQPEDVAKVVKFIASEDANFVNGATIPVNGGSRI